MPESILNHVDFVRDSALQDAATSTWVGGDATAQLEAALGHLEMLHFRPSTAAAAALLLGRRAVGAAPAWPPAIATLTGCQVNSKSKALTARLRSCWKAGGFCSAG